jgi:hypothetical protein
MEIIKIFGLPRSCTNLTTVLLRSNFNCIVVDNYPCWKHGFNTHQEKKLKVKNFETDNLLYIICTKNPIDWLWSLYCFENETKLKKKKTQEYFLENPSWHYKNMSPIEAFNKLNFHWLTMSDSKNIYQIKSEELQKNQIQELKKVKKYFNLDLKNKIKISKMENKVSPGGKLSEEKFKKRSVDWNDNAKKIIYKKIDKKTLSLCGYFFS